MVTLIAQRRRDTEPEHRKLLADRAKPLTFNPQRFINNDAMDARRKLHEAQEREREEFERERAWELFVRRRGTRYAECRLRNFEITCEAQQAVVAKMRQYQDHILDALHAGIGLLLYGPVGTGKDHLLIEPARLAIAAGKSVSWVNGADMFGMFRDNMDADDSERVLIERLIRPDVLYVSDPLPPIGELSWFRKETLFRIIDGRYSRGKPIWTTTNVAGGQELDDRMGPQNGTRLRDGTLCLFCNWPSHRKPVKDVANG